MYKTDHAATKFLGANQISNLTLPHFHRKLFPSQPRNNVKNPCDDVISQPEGARYPTHTKVNDSREL
jgi:hypothetical protein